LDWSVLDEPSLPAWAEIFSRRRALAGGVNYTAFMRGRDGSRAGGDFGQGSLGFLLTEVA